MSGDEHRLDGGWQTDVARSGDEVLRSRGSQSATVVGLLRHLHERGFQWAPKPVGEGFAVDGRERLSFIDGKSPQPAPWSDEAAWEIGRMLRHLHDTASDSHPSWRPQAMESETSLAGAAFRRRSTGTRARPARGRRGDDPTDVEQATG